VLTGACDSRLLQPSEFMDSRKEADAMFGDCSGGGARDASAVWLYRRNLLLGAAVARGYGG
jgi:hypothetical protein